MRTKQLLIIGAVIVTAAMGLAGCSYTSPDAGQQAVGALTETASPAGDPAISLTVPEAEPGEVLRLLYTAPESPQPITASAPQSQTGYILATACTADNGDTTLTIQLTDADDPASILLTDIVPCNGTAQVDEAINAGLPAQNVQLSFKDGLEGVTAAYSILTPSPS